MFPDGIFAININIKTKLMKKRILLPLLTLFSAIAAQAQVTQINSNKSLSPEYPLTASKAIFSSTTDQTVWVTDGTLAGTIQLSADIKFDNVIGSTSFLNGKLIFAGTTAATGTELYVTDGTPGGTVLVRDINAGPASSLPDGYSAVLNGVLYFTAATATEGRELWRTDGTLGGTTLVKDIVVGAGSSNDVNNYELFSTGTYLLFAAKTPTNGVELWRSDGTNAGTNLLLDINSGNAGADSSNPRNFFLLNNTVLFAATNASSGEEIWKTNGTSGGTTILLDINPGPASSTGIELAPGFNSPIFGTFHAFNNEAYFSASDGTSTGQVWKTDGTTANTSLLKDIVPAPSFAIILLTDALDLPNKFLFPVSDGDTRNEIWETDGTVANTKLFMSFDGGEVPFLFPAYSLTSLSQNPKQSLFQGNKFFFSANTTAAGRELWVSDGTVANTHVVANINAGAADGLDDNNLSYTYTTTAFYFPANNTTNGVELWKTDGTPGGTSMVADIVTGPTGSNTELDFFVTNGKVIFGADNGDTAEEPVPETDLYAVDGVFTPLPVKLLDFTVSPKNADAILNWHTSQELNSKDYSIQRSFDGSHFDAVGAVAAAGNSTTGKAYSFIDAGVMNSGKSIIYYRLVSTDVDGKSVFSPVITLKITPNGKWNVKLLSNPVSENIKLLLSGITASVQVSVVDINGKKLSTRQLSAVNGQISIPAANLPQGVYTLITETLNERKAIQFVK
jgi:ELWxxDGT repeat protein